MEMWYLMPCSSSTNLAEPSTTGAIPGALCNHPMSSEDPCKVFRTRDTTLERCRTKVKNM